MELPVTRYAKSGDVNIAYQKFGSGPRKIVFAPGFVSHVEHLWEHPKPAHFLQRLAGMGEVVIFDKRGTGLSDHVASVATLDHRMDDIRAVMDAAGFDHSSLIGISEGGAMCQLFAATHPTRVEALSKDVVIDIGCGYWHTTALVQVYMDSTMFTNAVERTKGRDRALWFEESKVAKRSPGNQRKAMKKVKKGVKKVIKVKKVMEKK